MSKFCVYPAIDLRKGQVVRLKEGDPNRQTTYFTHPAEAARQWVDAGARWLHLVNLDGAFEEGDQLNLAAIKEILAMTQASGVPVQLGGGVRSLDDIEFLLKLGVSRVILGTAVTKNPQLLPSAIRRFDAEQIVVSLDARDGYIKTAGWQQNTNIKAHDFAKVLAEQGLRHLVFTDIARDGMQQGLNVSLTLEIARHSGLQVIASGGVAGWDDITAAASASLAGVIVGKALYEGIFDPFALFSYSGGMQC